MSILLPVILILAAQATNIGDLCEPVTDPKSPAPYCILETVTLIETPYYTLTIQPRQVIHMWDEGRVLEVLPSPRQSPIGLSITIDNVAEEELLRTLASNNCPDPVLTEGRLLRCESIAEGGYLTRVYGGRVGGHLITVGYYRSPLARLAPGEEGKFETMLESIVLKP